MGGRTASSGGCGGACDATLVENASTEPDSTSTALSTAGPCAEFCGQLKALRTITRCHANGRVVASPSASVQEGGGGGHAWLKS